MVLAHESFVLACFLRISKHRECLGQPINLVTTASDEDPCADPESFVRGGPTLQVATLATFFSFLFLEERGSKYH